MGIEASPSFVREPQGDRVAERFIRTLKENLLWARTFDTIEELRAASRASSSPGTTTKPGSSPATVIVPQPRYEPLKASLITTHGRSKVGCLNRPSRMPQNCAAAQPALPAEFSRRTTIATIALVIEIKMSNLKYRQPIAVIGARKVGDPKVYTIAQDLGRALAIRGFPIVCGGKHGVMEAVCQGCSEAQGLSIGILSHVSDEPNCHCTVTLFTDLGNESSAISKDPDVSRNRVLVVGALCVFAVSGSTGSANELKFAKEARKRVFGLCDPPEPEGHDRASVWNSPNSGFTLCSSLDDAMIQFDKFLSSLG